MHDVDPKYKFGLMDIHRLSAYIDTSIFSTDDCILYNRNVKKKKYKRYITFYFNGKKRSLHRLLYQNYIGPLTNEYFIRYNCVNHSKCININHLKKMKYNRNKKQEIVIREKIPVSLTLSFE